MKTIHEYLLKQSKSYVSWHNTPYHSHVHWGILILVVFLVGYSFVARNVPASVVSGDPKVFATTNGLHILGKDEYALIYSGAISLNPIEKIITLKDGSEIPIKKASKGTLKVVEYDPNVTNYIPTDSPGVEIHSLYDFTGYDKNGIDTAIERKLKKQSEVSVIIQMKSTTKFYDKNDNANDRAEKIKSFNNKKASISLAIKGNGSIKRDLKIINGLALNINIHALEALKKNPNIQKVNLDRPAHLFLDESVSEINAPYAWSLIDPTGNTITGRGIRIAIIDTGVDYTHPDLGGCFGSNCKVVDGWDFFNNDADPMDDYGHGTHVAATAAGNGLLKGVAPDAKILAYKVCDAGGYCGNIIAAIDRAVDPNQDGNSNDHADVISMSLGVECGNGTYSSGCGPNDSMSIAIDNASAVGVISTISAGNAHNDNPPSTVGSPGTASTAITVAAACKASGMPGGSNPSNYCNNGPIASFSSRGPVIVNGVDFQKPDISAPGVLICAARWASAFAGSPTCFDNSHIRISGTSMAAPHMAGVVALMKQANPTYTPAQIKQRLKDTATSLTGMTYNDQGAGEVNVQAAIPLISQATVTPVTWQDVTTIATQKLSVTNQNFSVTSTNASINSLTVNFTSPVPGITFTSSKTTLNVVNLGTDTFTGTITVDNDVVSAGRYISTIYLSENSTNKVAIPVSIIVSPTVTASVTNLDYGNDNPDLSSWTSESKTITLTNKRTDIPQTLSVSQSTYPAGITYQTGASSTITLSANSSVTLTTNFVVNNAVVANGTYPGSLSLTNDLNAIQISTKFTKYYSIKFQSQSATRFISYYTIVKNDRSEYYYGYFDANFNHTVYVNSAGPYNIEISFYDNGGYGLLHEIGKEGIIPNTSPVIINTSESNRLIRIVPIDIGGSQISANTFSNAILYWTAMGIGEIEFSVSTNLLEDMYITNTSSTNKFSRIIGTNSGVNPFYQFGGIVPTNTGNYTFTNTPADFKDLSFTPSVNVAPGGNINPIVFMCSNFDMGCFCVSDSYSNQTIPYTHKIYSAIAQSGFWNLIRIFEDNEGIYNGQYPCSSFPCPSRFWTPAFDLVTKTQKATVWSSNNNLFPFLIDNNIQTGMGPAVWMAKFNNSSSLIKLVAPYVEESNFYPNQYVGNSYIFRQDLSVGENNQIPYQIYKSVDGEITQQVDSGYTPKHKLGITFSDNNQFVSLPTTPDQYQFKTSFSYLINNQNMNTDIVALFDTSLSDPNPPAIKRFGFYVGTNHSEFYNSTTNNSLELELDPNGGTISSLETSYSTDNTNYTTLSNTVSNGVYTIPIPPSISNTGKISLRLKAIDSANNYLQYTFEMPTTSAVILPSDTTPPTVSMTAPSNGATISGTVTLSANATDNVGVSHVDFYRGTTLIGFDSSSPYSISWNTTTVTNGAYALSAKAYDAAGNIGTSTGVNITVSNLAVIFPTVTLTSPSNDFVVYTTHSIPLTFSVAGTPTSCWYDLGGTATYPLTNCQSTTLTLSNGDYVLNVSAQNSAGTDAASSIFRVTVLPDNTSPTVTITSPTNPNLPNHGNVNVTAHATDASGIASIVISIDGTVQKTCTAVTTCTYNWNMNQVSSGSHTILATAKDNASPQNTGTATMTVTK
jgi:hypothetical protein